MLNTKVDCDESGGTHHSRATRGERKGQHKTHTSKSKSKATAWRRHTRLKPGEGPPGCLGSAGEGRMHAKPGTRLGSDGAATPCPESVWDVRFYETMPWKTKDAWETRGHAAMQFPTPLPRNPPWTPMKPFLCISYAIMFLCDSFLPSFASRRAP